MFIYFVLILYCRPGSIITNYTVVFEAEEAYTNYNAIELSLYQAYEELLNATEVGGFTVNDTYLSSNMPSQISNGKLKFGCLQKLPIAIM